MKDTALEMVRYYSGDIKRTEHFLKVYAYARIIAEGENADKKTIHIIETAALTHDIGIKPSERKYGSSAGRYQELEGPPEAVKLLERVGEDKETIERVCWLIAHHHTYNCIDALDYRILVEADFLVNLSEDGCSREAVLSAREKIFRTKTGTELLDRVFAAEE